MDKFLVAPSTDPAKSDEELVKYVCELQGIADILHCDVMDGRFVGRKTINYDQIRRIRDTTTMFLDVHLMIEKPWLYVQKYAECGANLITVHYECFKENKQLLSCFEDIRNNGCLVGLSIKP
ncbi:MAG: ribulose-phosphate 3-epimerase, partial [Clostridia bacterium]|nr:ribulose-phosphate 3-epimerase [Clostridia bacterium]